jgi:O-antigen/teichoic acid export membrane protein
MTEAGRGAGSGSGRGAASEGYEDYVGRIARGAGISSFGQGIGKLLGYLIQVVVIGGLYGPAAFGFYVAGASFVQFANILSQFGLDNGVVRYVAHYRAEGDTARVRGTILQAIGLSVGLSLALSAAIFLGAPLIAGLIGKPFLETVWRSFSVAVPFVTLMSMSLWATQGFQTVKYATLVQQVVRPLAQLVLLIVFYAAGVEVLGAVASYALSMALGAALALYYLHRVFPKLLDRSVPARFESRALFGVSGPMSVVTLANNLNALIPIWVLTVFVPIASVGVFSAAFKTAALSSLALVAFSGIFSPMISSLYRQGLREELGRLYGDVSRWTFTGAFAIFLVVALLSRDLLAVFGPRYVDAWPVVALVAAAQCFSASVGPTGRMLAMTGNQRVVMGATLAATAVGLVLCVALVPRFGIVGAGVGAAASVVLVNVVTLTTVRRRLGYVPFNRAYLKPLLAGLLASGTILALNLVLPLPAGILTLLVLGPLFGLLFTGALLLFGLSASDKEMLGEILAATRRKLGRPRRAPDARADEGEG